MPSIIPYNFDPRSYQLPLFKAIDNGYRRGICIWHRRAGKDKTFFNVAVKKAAERVGAIYYYFPTMSQGRKVIWQGRDKAGYPFLGHIPPDFIRKKSDQEMRLEFVNGSSLQILGTDRLEVVGPNPIGCIFSEFSLQNPRGWDYVRPILAENNGWALFNGTPRGMNHLYKMYNIARAHPEDWFSEVLTVDDTHAITQEAIDLERRAGMSEALVKQEFYCDWTYGLEGAYYVKQINKCRSEGRICKFPLEDLPVHTAWDIGIGDSTSIWFFQLVGREVHLLDYYENQGEGLKHYVKILKEKTEQYDWVYKDHIAPHDIKVREWSNGKSRIDRAKEFGIDFTIADKVDIGEGIEAVRALFPRCVFLEEPCEAGILSLMHYQKLYDEKYKVFKDKPQHDWASHGADAFRTLAIGLKKMVTFNQSTELGPEYYGRRVSSWAAR
jgi:hypothetical protein